MRPRGRGLDRRQHPVRLCAQPADPGLDPRRRPRTRRGRGRRAACSARSAPAGPATEAAELLETLDRAGRPALEIGALGRFRVLRDGEPVPPTAWQSKKARDLLKILVAASRPADDPRDAVRAAVARRGPGAAGEPAVRRAGDGARRARSREAVRGRLVRGRRQAGGLARPRPTSSWTSRRSSRPRPRACGCARGRRRRRRDARSRPPRAATAATSSRRTRTRTGPSGSARRRRRRTSR